MPERKPGLAVDLAARWPLNGGREGTKVRQIAAEGGSTQGLAGGRFGRASMQEGAVLRADGRVRKSSLGRQWAAALPMEG